MGFFLGVTDLFSCPISYTDDYPTVLFCPLTHQQCLISSSSLSNWDPYLEIVASNVLEWRNTSVFKYLIISCGNVLSSVMFICQQGSRKETSACDATNQSKVIHTGPPPQNYW